MSADAAVTEILQSIVPGEAPLVESLVQMHLNTLAADASEASYRVNLTVADDVGITADDVRGVLIALGPVVGSARVLSGAKNALKAIASARQR